MSDHPRDVRIKFSIGTNQHGDHDGLFQWTTGLTFDHHRGLLLVSDYNNYRVQVFSSHDGSFVSKFGEKGTQPGQFKNPYGIAIDEDHDHILVTDHPNNRMQVWSLINQSFISCIGQRGSRDLEFDEPRSVAIDKNHHHIIIADAWNHRLQVLSSIDLSFLFSIGKKGTQPCEFVQPSGVAVDHDRDRIIVADKGNQRVQVLSSIDGSFLFMFGSYGNQPGQFKVPQGVCIANQGRIIITDTNNHRLQSFTHDGHHISSFHCDEVYPWDVAFDSHRGLIAFSSGNQVHVIGTNQWLPDTLFVWSVDRHVDAPERIKQEVLMMTMIRSLMVEHESSVSLLPNEILFEIFQYL